MKMEKEEIFKILNIIKDFLNLYTDKPGIKEVKHLLWSLQQDKESVESLLNRDLIKLEAIEETIESFKLKKEEGDNS